jgi:hypothetical protein
MAPVSFCLFTPSLPEEVVLTFGVDAGATGGVLEGIDGGAFFLHHEMRTRKTMWNFIWKVINESIPLIRVLDLRVLWFLPVVTPDAQFVLSLTPEPTLLLDLRLL